jgi:NAD(P)-dependent dehydrogenase (short-subunit alcohol dehydrogenase family)
MDDFRGRLAVITGAGSGMGRELALQLIAAGAHVAICDVFADSLAEATRACQAAADGKTRVTAHSCDVADEAQVLELQAEVAREHASDHIELLFNNAGIGGGGSFVKDERRIWDRTFQVNWLGVYHCTRAFLPMLLKSTGACIVNTSSVNGFFAIGPSGPHTAYCASKFAVKGFSEALLTDLRLHAPHVKVLLVMPGHIGTSIVANSLRSQGVPTPEAMTSEQLVLAAKTLAHQQPELMQLDEQQLRSQLRKHVDAFKDSAPVSAAQAATVILNGIRAGRWRILIGKDAEFLDQLAREHPEELYEPTFLQDAVARMPRS